MNILEKLLKIQTELKVPKSQYNSFGKYNFRNAEDILEAAKPLCKEVNAVLTLSDEIVSIGDRYYVRALARLTDTEIGADGNIHFIDACAMAREEADKKGMDGSQVTGSSSSYARKYALSGLFAIDDTKDSDTTNKGEYQGEKASIEQEKTDKAKAGAKPLTLAEAENITINTESGDIKLKNLTIGQLERLLKNESMPKYQEAARLILEFKAQ